MPTRAFRYVLGSLSLAGFLTAGFVIYERYGRDALWGHWPLLLFLGGWGVIVALRQNLARLRYLGLASLAGSALAFGFPPLVSWPLLALGFGVLLHLTDRLGDEPRGVRYGWWYFYHAFVLYNVGATWWVANTALAAGIVANFLNALLMTVPWIAILLARRHLPKFWLGAAVAAWIGFEYLHYNWEIAWPWLCFGNALSSTPGLAQWYSYTGVFGGSLYVCTVGTLGYSAYRKWRSAPDRLPVARIAQAGLVLVCPLGLSLVMSASDLEPDLDRVSVAAVQPNLEPHYVKFVLSPAAERRRYFDLLERIPANTDLVLLPETSFGSVDEANVAGAPFVKEWRRLAQARGLDAGLLAGITSYAFSSVPTDDPAQRERPTPGGATRYYVVYNSAAAVDGGEPTGLYHKSKRVPGVEFLPYRGLLFFFEPLVRSLGGTTAGLGVSERAEVLGFANGARVAPLICYESVYGDYVREFTDAGANLLVVPTNDGWWDDTAGHVQHLYMARLRAIENRRWVVQAANSGVSAIIDPRGDIVQATGYNETALLNGEVGLRETATFYMRYGDFVGRISAGAASLLLLSLGAAIWRQRVGAVD